MTFSAKQLLTALMFFLQPITDEVKNYHKWMQLESIYYCSDDISGIVHDSECVLTKRSNQSIFICLVSIHSKNTLMTLQIEHV